MNCISEEKRKNVEISEHESRIVHKTAKEAKWLKALQKVRQMWRNEYWWQQIIRCDIAGVTVVETLLLMISHVSWFRAVSGILAGHCDSYLAYFIVSVVYRLDSITFWLNIFTFYSDRKQHSRRHYFWPHNVPSVGLFSYFTPSFRQSELDSKYTEAPDLMMIQQDSQFTLERNFETRSRNHCCCVKVTSITYSDCAFVALGIHYIVCMPHTVTCGLSGSTIYIFSHYLINVTILEI